VMEYWSNGFNNTSKSISEFRISNTPTLQYSITPGFIYQRKRKRIFFRKPRPSLFLSSNQIRRSQLRENQANEVEVLIQRWLNSKSALNFRT
jgi:hypothetical protein